MKKILMMAIFASYLQQVVLHSSRELHSIMWV